MNCHLQKTDETNNTSNKAYRLVCMQLMLPILGLFLWIGSSQAQENVKVLSLENAIFIAQENDLWQQKSQAIEASYQSLSEGANSLPDPTLSLAVMNLPTDGFTFNQEPMTQLKVGITQMLPQGDTLNIKQQQHSIAASKEPLLREDRRLQITLTTTTLWLDAYNAQQKARIIEKSRPLFVKLSELVSNAYGSSSGNTNQQDIIEAELELTRLQDRLIQMDTQRNIAFASLNEYLASLNKLPFDLNSTSDDIPQYLNDFLSFDDSISAMTDAELAERLSKHPKVMAYDKQIALSQKTTELAEQGHKPQWGLNASYAYRSDDPEGRSRADFFSVGVSVKLPVFSSTKTDSEVMASTKLSESMITEKRLLLRQLISGIRRTFAQIQGAQARIDVYTNNIIPQITQQAQAALVSYTNDSGNFADVVRARIAELDANIHLLDIQTNNLKAIAQLQFLLAFEAKQYHHNLGALNDESRTN